jgi:hypothetical protein
MRRSRMPMIHIYLVGFLLLIPSCASVTSQRTLEDVKSQLDCVAYSDEMPWEQVKTSLGREDEAPIPGPGTLFTNARVYTDKVLIFHVDTKEITEAGRSKFVEVVKKIDLCKEK